MRYADDFVLGFIGPKAEAGQIKGSLETFLRDSLKLELSREKTLITHATSQAARFLDYELVNQQTNTRLDPNGRRSVNGHIGLRFRQSHRATLPRIHAQRQTGKSPLPPER